MFGIGDPAKAVLGKLSVMGVDKWLAFVLALTESLISDECTNEVKDSNMTPRAYRLRGSEHFSGPFYAWPRRPDSQYGSHSAYLNLGVQSA